MTYATSVMDQLMVISSPMLLLKLFGKVAPSVSGALPTPTRHYTDQSLAEGLIKLMDSMPCSMKAEHDDLMAALDTIAVIAADSGNAVFLRNLIRQDPELRSVFDLYPIDQRVNAWTVGNLSAWIYLEGTPQMWNSLVTEATIFKDTKMQWMSFSITDPEAGYDRKAGMAMFCEDFSRLKKLEKRMDDYPVDAEYGLMPEAMRYVFSTPCDPQIVKKFVRKHTDENGKEVPEKRGEETEKGRLVHDYGINDNATGFIVDYYEKAEYVRVSVVESQQNTRSIAEAFVEKVLKAKLKLNDRRRYYKIAPFRTRDYSRHMKVPDEYQKWVASINVTAIDMQYTDRNGRQYAPYTCHDCKNANIFDDLEQVFDPERFPPELRNPLGARVSVALFKGHYNESNCCGPTEKTKTYTFDIGLRRFHWVTEMKGSTVEEQHRKILKRLIKDWDFEGLNPDRFALGKGAVEVKGEEQVEMALAGA